MSGFVVPSIWIVLGLVVLIVGGELLVRGASALAVAMSISPLVVGLTVVAFGTSAPELAVSLQAAVVGKGDLAVGNVVGSNIANVLLILGLAAIVAPLLVTSRLIRVDVPLMIGAAMLLPIVGWDGNITRIEGLVLFSILVGYIISSIWASRQEVKVVQEEFAHEFELPQRLTLSNIAFQLALVLGGLIALGFGAQWLVSGSVTIARQFGVSELIIGLTIVAIGTSLPEVVTSVMASLRNERDIAVGNVVGSNMFNILCVLGLTSIVARDGIDVSAAAMRFDIPIMIAVSFVCLPIFFTGQIIDRWEGGIFLAYYAIYLTYLVLDATRSPLAPGFGTIVLYLAIPLTVIVLTIGVSRSLREQRRKRRDERP